MSPVTAIEIGLIKLNRNESKKCFQDYIANEDVWKSKKCPRCSNLLAGPERVLDPHNNVLDLFCLICGFHSFKTTPRSFQPDPEVVAVEVK